MIATADILAGVIWLAVCAGNVLLAGWFAGMETGAYLVNRVRLELQAEAGRKRAKQVRAFLHDPNNVLATLLIGTNIHQYIAAFAVSALFVLAGYEDNAEWYTLAVTTPLLFVFKDSLPKNLFQRMPEKLVYRTIWPMRCFGLLYKLCGLTYLVRGFAWVLLRLLGKTAAQPQSLLGHEALLAVVAEGHAAGALTGAQREMADRVMHISHVRVADVLQPMEQVLSAPAGVSREEFLRRITERNHSRLPLLDENHRVTGVVDVYDVLTDRTDRPIRVYAVEPLIVSADQTVTEALYAMQHARRSLAVVEAGGKHVGIITIKDLVEEIVGELAAW
jgi:putative hemolysin